MSDGIFEKTQKMFNAAQGQKMPEHVQKLVEEALAKAQEANAQANMLMQNAAKNLEGVYDTTQSGLKQINEKVLENVATNSQAAFDFGNSILKAKTPVEAMQMQGEFLKTQMALVTAQTQEIFELSTEVGKENVNSIQAAAQKSLDASKFKA